MLVLLAAATKELLPGPVHDVDLVEEVDERLHQDDLEVYQRHDQRREPPESSYRHHCT